MSNVKEILLEELKTKALKHLIHLEDHIIHNGHEGAGVAAQHLDDVAKTLQGKKTTTHISTKYDGAPAVIFGQHPETGKFFVGTKSVFNKTPKINYTDKDIDANHGHAPGLAAKLKDSLVHLPKVMPKNGGVYQGDLMHTPEDVEKKDGKTHFTPNTITYSVDDDTAHGKAIANSKLGVVVHTKYSGRGGLGNMSAGPVDKKTRTTFASHGDVHNIDPTIDVNPSNFTAEERAEYSHHKAAANKAYSKMKPESMDALDGHGVKIETHINDMVRKGGDPSVDGLVDHLNKKSQKAIDSVSMQKSKDKKAAEHSKLVDHIEGNREHFKKAFEVHSHLQKAKDVLVNVMAKNNPFGHTVGGEPTKPEGAVAVDKSGNMTKLVDRKEFSRQNFLRSKMGSSEPVNESLGATTSSEPKYNGKNGIHNAFGQMMVKIKPPVEGHIPQRAGSNSVAGMRRKHQTHLHQNVNQVAVREETDSPNKHLVMSYVRMNPVHEGHAEVAKTVMNTAKGVGGEHKIILSHSHDSNKNPLSPDQKLKHAQRAFPDANIEVSNKQTPTILHHLSKAHDEGRREVTIVGGSDRDEFSGLAKKYNGVEGKHGYYKMKINFAQAGADRDEGKGVASYSASKMRTHATNGDMESFKKMAPKSMSDDHKEEMYHDTRNAMIKKESIMEAFIRTIKHR